MKTRKEQIDEMANIIKADYKQWLDITGVFPEGSSYYFECLGGGEDCAELLYNAGYGDVSEYKAEIERLQSNIPQHLKDLLIEFDEMGFAPTTVCPNPDKYATEWRDRLVNCVNNATKQAQIDVLNFLKDGYEVDISTSNDCDMVVRVDDIDELIEELQNGEDKG